MKDTAQPTMRVLFLTHRLPFAPNRGDRIRAYHMLRHLSAHATVDLVSLVHDSDEASATATVPADRVTVVPVTPWRNRVRAGLSLSGSRPLTHALLDAPSLVETIADVCRANRPDVVLAFCSGMARLATTAPLKDIPLVVDMVDVDSAKWRALSRATRPPMAWIYGREATLPGTFRSRSRRARPHDPGRQRAGTSNPCRALSHGGHQNRPKRHRLRSLSDPRARQLPPSRRLCSAV